MKKIKKSTIILIIIILLGSFFRFLNIGYQLPELYLPDEQFFVDPALHIANGHWNPGWFGAGQLIIYAIGFSFRIISFFVNIFSGMDLPAELNYQQHFILFYTSARSLFALFGTLMILVIYFLAKFWNQRTALISAFLVASSFYLIDHSHIIRPDIPQTLFILLFLLFLFKIFDHPQRTNWYVLSGLSIGAAFTAKYPALFILPTAVGIFIWLIIKKEFYLKKWIIFCIVSLMTAFATGPFLFISFKATIRQIGLENATSHGVHGGLGFFGNLQWYLFETLHWEMGTFLYLSASITFIILMYRVLRKKVDKKEGKLMIIGMTAFIYILVLSFLNLHWERWAIPALTLLFIPSAVALDYLFSKIKNKLLLFLIIVVLFIGPGLRLSRTIYGYANYHTIDQAKQWMLKNLPIGSKIIREPYTPELPKNDYQVISIPNLGFDRSSKYYTDNSQFYFAISESVYGIILERAGSMGEENFKKAADNYQYLISRSELIYEINPNNEFTTSELINSSDIFIIKKFTPRLLIGPYIRVYRYNHES